MELILMEGLYNLLQKQIHYFIPTLSENRQKKKGSTISLTNNLKTFYKTIAQQGVFFYAGFRIYPDRHNADQLQSQLYEHNRALEYTLSFLSLISNSTGLKYHGISAQQKALDVVCHNIMTRVPIIFLTFISSIATMSQSLTFDSAVKRLYFEVNI